MAKVLAMTADGRLTYCEAPPDKRGIGRCNHVCHQENGESEEEFAVRAAQINFEKEQSNPTPEEPEIVENKITDEEILGARERLYEILGTRDVTRENLLDLVNELPPDKQHEVFKLGFEYSSYFAFPVDFDRNPDEELAAKISLSNMGNYGLGAKQKHIDMILKEVGDYVTKNGTVHISGNFKDGLNEDEWWDMQFATRRASVNKTVSVAVPGAPIASFQETEIRIDI